MQVLAIATLLAAMPLCAHADQQSSNDATEVSVVVIPAALPATPPAPVVKASAAVAPAPQINLLSLLHNAAEDANRILAVSVAIPVQPPGTVLAKSSPEITRVLPRAEEPREQIVRAKPCNTG